jgi:hypothetical protein
MVMVEIDSSAILVERVGLAEILHAGAEVTPSFLSLCLLELVQEDVAADGGGDDNSHGFQFSCGDEECVVVGLNFLLEVERIVDCYVKLIVHLVGGGTVGSLSDGLEELFDGPIVDDGLEFGAVGGA